MTIDDLMSKLEDAEARERLDAAGFHAMLGRLPEQSRIAWKMGLEADLGEVRRPDRVVLIGLGGSAIGADVAATLATELSATPVQVVRNYHLPPLTSDTLVILCSFSGNTEEALQAFEEVTTAGAQGIAITTGGKLKELATAAGMPLITYEWAGPPRTGLGYGVFLPLAILRRLEVLELSDADVEDGLAALDRATQAYGLEGDPNEAKRLAAWLYGGVPAIIGPDIMEVAARRWAGEMSENAKQVAAAHGLPEFNHNQVEAAARPTEADPLRFVFLDAPVAHPRNRLRARKTAELIGAAGREAQVVDAGGDTPLAAILASCVLGSWTSYYLALLRDEEPAPVPIMEQLKRTLAGAG